MFDLPLPETLEDEVIRLKQALWLAGEEALRWVAPKHLQVRVSGAFYPGFHHHGLHLFYCLERAAQAVGLTFRDRGQILDFGCGCGRVLIPASRNLGRKLTGCEIDPEAVEWCRQHLQAFGDFSLNPNLPPSPFPSGWFDAIYGVSVFTHLPEAMQFAWLDDLFRITRPGGFAVFTVHGPSTFSNLQSTETATMENRGFVYQSQALETAGLPSYYKLAFHTPEYIRSQWTRGWEVLSIQDRGLDTHDTVVLRRPV